MKNIPIKDRTQSIPVSPWFTLWIFTVINLFCIFFPIFTPQVYAKVKSYSIQVGAYKVLDNAVEKVNRLKKLGHNAYYRHETVKNKGKWYRVYTGRYSSKQKAKKEADVLKKSNLTSEFLIRTVDKATRKDSSYSNRKIKNSYPHINFNKQNNNTKIDPEETYAQTESNTTNLPANIIDTRPGSTAVQQEKSMDLGGSYYDFGVFAYEDEDYEGAENNFLKALEFDSNNSSYNYFLGKTYLKTKRYEEALAYFDKARELDPDMSGLKYDTAFAFYKMSNYLKAADLFSEVVRQDPTNVLAIYHAGINYYNLERYSKALDYFITASDKSSSIKANGYYYAGICYRKMGKIEEAIEKFEYVRDSAASGLLRENAVKWLQAIESQKEALKAYSLYLKVSYQYDDNVRLEPLNQDLFANEDDYAKVVVFSGRYNVVNRPDYKFGAGYNHYQSVYDNLNAFDLTGSTGNFYAKYRLDKFTLGFSYLPTYYWLDDKSYLMRHQVKPEVVWRMNDNISTRFSYSYYRNNYMQNNDKDGHTHEGSLDAYYTVKDKAWFLFAGIGYEDNTASHLDQYYGQWKTKLGISYDLFWELNLGLTVKYYNKKYDNVDSNYGVTREDDKYYGTVSLSRKLFYDWLSLVAEFTRTKNDSKISIYDYKRNVTTFSLTTKY